MGKIFFSVSISIDGFLAGENRGPENPIGDGGTTLHQWPYKQKAFQTVAETPIADQCPAGMQQHIMHSILEKDGAILMATDMSRPGGVTPGNDMAISLNFDHEERYG